MTVQQLIDLLSKQDSWAQVGCAIPSLSGWVQQVKGVTQAPDGTVVIVQGEECLFEDEVPLA